MGANYHGGEQVLNYPWDASCRRPMIPVYAPDDQLFYDFGMGYTSRNPDLWNNPDFDYGITRGWEWYRSMEVCRIGLTITMENTMSPLEISGHKSPDFNLMDGFWNRNRDAMLWWLQRVWTGLGGQVLDAQGQRTPGCHPHPGR